MMKVNHDDDSDAPAAVAAFTALCGSGLQVPCRDVDFSAEVTERAKQSKKATLRGCLSRGANVVNVVSLRYCGSALSEIAKAPVPGGHGKWQKCAPSAREA